MCALHTWEPRQLLTVNEVFSGNQNFLEIIQDVELGKVEGVIAIDQV